MPKKEEIIKKVGISPERYYDVMDASRPVSLNARNPVTQEEFIDGIADDEGDEKRQPALLRLALDDVVTFSSISYLSFCFQLYPSQS